MKNEELTGKIIGASFIVHNILGYGFLEKVYKNALAFELKKNNLNVEIEYPIKVKYQNQVVGEYFADLFVEKQIIVEIKAVKELRQVHEVQLVNYLKATGIEIGILINFGKSVVVKRKILDL